MKDLTPDTSYELKNVTVYDASVVSVDAESYEMVLFSEAEGISGPVEIPSLFMNIRDGEGGGAHILPEVGSKVWVCQTSDGTLLPLLYHGSIGEDYRGSRPVGIPGDIYLGTRDGNQIGILKGSSIIIESTPVCKILMDPIEDSIRSFSSTSHSYTLSYTKECTVDRSNENTLTHETFYKNAEDEDPIIEIKTGSVGNNVYEFSLSSEDFYKYLTSEGHVNLFTNNIEATSNNIVYSAEDIHIKPELVTVGDKSLADSVILSTAFLTDLNTQLTALSALLTAISSALPPVASATTPVITAITNIQNKIGLPDSPYVANKLKTE